MPTYRQRLQNLTYINGKKREKIRRREREQIDASSPERGQPGTSSPERGQPVRCKRCGEQGHLDGRSRLCKLNKKYSASKAESSKRKREGETDSDDEKTTAKKQATTANSPTMSEASLGSQSSSYASTSTKTRSTTATIRSRIKGVLSAEVKTARRISRAAGKELRLDKIKNPAARIECKYCVDRGLYDPNYPHTTTRSKNCSGHQLTTEECIEQNLGRNYSRCIRKAGIHSLVLLDGDGKRVFLRILNETVVNFRMIAIKSQLFAAYYIRHCLSDGAPLPAIIFNQAFFYACIQLVLERPITNSNVNLPRGHMNQLFAQYNLEFLNNTFVNLPRGNTVHANALAALANASASNFVNFVTETYPKRLYAFIKLRVRESFNLESTVEGHLVEYIFNVSVNSNQNNQWPPTLQNNVENRAKLDRITNLTRISNSPVSLTHISANPEIYVRKMYDFLVYIEQFNDDQIRTHNEVQVECSYAHIALIIRANDIFRNLNRRRKKRLSFGVFKSIRDNTNFANNLNLDNEELHFIQNFIATTRRQIQNSRVYLAGNNNNVTSIEECFRPEMNATVKKYKVFTLVPSYTLTRKYMEIDYVHLKSLLLKVESELGVNIIDEGESDNKHERATHLFSQTFDFEAVRLDINYNGRVMFTNMVRTDGYGIDFILARPKDQIAALGDLELSDFTTEELQETFHLWGADPGLTNIYTAVDGHGNDPHQVIKYSTDEYYTRAGFKSTNRRILRFKQSSPNIQHAERFASHKTASLQRYLEHVHSVMNNLDTLLLFYDHRFTELRQLNYIGRQRANAEMANMFISGGKKYMHRQYKQSGRDLAKKGERKIRRKRPKKNVENETVKKSKGKGREKVNKHRPLPLRRDGRIPLISLGDAVFATSMRGKIPGLARRLSKVLKQAEYQGLLVMVPVTEYMTSQTCSRCGEARSQNVLIDGVSLFGVLRCTNCNTLWQRDINASRNMHCISRAVIADGEVPQRFRR